MNGVPSCTSFNRTSKFTNFNFEIFQPIYTIPIITFIKCLNIHYIID